MVVKRVDRQRTPHKGLEFLLCAHTSCAVLYVTVLYCTERYCAVLPRTVLRCTVRYHHVRYCTVLLFITVSFHSSSQSVHDMIRNYKVKKFLWLL